MSGRGRLTAPAVRIGAGVQSWELVGRGAARNADEHGVLGRRERDAAGDEACQHGSKAVKALKACRSKPKKKRALCERQAKKRYGAVAKRSSKGGK